MTYHSAQVNAHCINPSQTSWYAIYLPRINRRLRLHSHRNEYEYEYMSRFRHTARRSFTRTCGTFMVTHKLVFARTRIWGTRTLPNSYLCLCERSLSWCWFYVPRWFTCPQAVTHPALTT